MLDKASVSRRTLDFEDYMALLRRNFRWLLGPLFAGLVISTVVAYLLKDTYISQALVRIVPQQISADVVPDITAQDVADRINGMVQTIESHTTLSNIIASFGLYPKELKRAPMEDVIAQMKSAIRIKPVEGVTNVTGKSLPAIQIQFAYRDPVLAQKVCADIVSRFMNASTTESTDIEQQANTFINDQVEQAKKDLETIDQKLVEFKTRNAGRLPEEVSANMAQMNALEQRGASLSDQQARNADQATMLQAELARAKERLAAAKASSPQTQAQSQKVNELDREIDQLETSIASMKNRYTDDFPDLQAAKERLTLLKSQREEAFKDKPKADANAPETFALSSERAAAQNYVSQIETQIKVNATEAARMQKQSAQVNAALSGFESRLNGLPAGEKEYSDLLRDRELVKSRYDNFQVKLQRSAAQIELNRRKQGQTLELLDAASLPNAPSEPKRYVIAPIGAVIGLVIGLLIVGFREMKDTSLKSLKDARLYSQLPILGSIPLLENDVVVQRRKQIAWVGWAAAMLIGMLIMAGSVAHYYMSKA
ncbi:MAG: hypothetical protein M3Y72_23685 [Acidobacteriota bacterium]|nr:hypothetical protein [Acidobacteriota bacterium]